MKKVLGILLSIGFAFCGLFFGTGCVSLSTYENAARYSVGNFTYAAADVKEVEIDWISGSVEVVQSTETTLSVTEAQVAETSAEQMHYWLDGSTLRIRYCESGYKTKISDAYKELRVEIPVGISVEIESDSAEIHIGEISAKEISVETVSGNVMGDKWTCQNAEVDCVSGSVTLHELSANEATIESNSGKIELGLAKKGEIELETISGDITLTLLGDLGARIDFASVSGKFKTGKEYAKNGRRYDVFAADGVSTDCNIEADTVSGDLEVR